MRKALVVGIDFYKNLPKLHGCVNDAVAVNEVLAKHSNGAANFGTQLVTAGNENKAVTRSQLKDLVRDLFADESDIALFYFAGHGHIESTGGYLCDSECSRGDDGLFLGEVMTLADKSKARNKFIVLDSCHSGFAGSPAEDTESAILSNGMTILTASTSKQYASEKNGSGVFTTLFINAMNGAAANLTGDITPGSVYAHIDQSLGPWQQRPVFRTNVKNFVSLRKVQPPIELADLLRLTELFTTVGFEYKLNPSFEPEMAGRPEGAPPPDPKNVEIFAVLQKYNRVNLLVPHEAPHMWHAAMESKACRLTVLGEHYRHLVEQNLIR